MKWSNPQTVKSNARRTARALGVNTNKVVACKGGWHFPLPATMRDYQTAKPTKTGRLKKLAGKPVDALKAATSAPRTMSAKPGRAAKGSSGKHADKIFAMMTDAKGAAMTDIIKLTGWLAHTSRARLSAIRAAHATTHDFDRTRILNETFYYAKPKAKAAKAA